MRFKIFFVVTIAAAAFFVSSTAFCETFESHKEAGDRYLRAGQTSPAIAEYQKALRLNPGSTAVSFNLAIAYYKERNLIETVSTLERIVQLDPNDYEAYYNLGCLRLYQKDFDAACDCFRKARACCGANQDFSRTLEDTLAFVSKLKTLDPQTQNAVLLSLAARSLLQ